MAKTISERLQDAVALNPHLHPEQEAITWGSYFVCPAGANDDSELAYGLIPTWADFLKAGQDMSLITGETDKLDDRIEKTQLLAAEHLFPCVMFGVLFPAGTPYLIHASTIWPISQDTFRAARRAGFEVPVMQAGDRARLLIATVAWRAHFTVTFETSL